MQQLVLPIKDDLTLHQVQQCLLENGKAGRRNYTIFQVGKATLLRISDVLRLKTNDVFDAEGKVKTSTYIRDKKTGKANILYLKPVFADLEIYYQWLQSEHIESEWLFPSIRNYERHIIEKTFYKIMFKVGKDLDLNYLGTHTMRKTGAYRVYQQSNYNIGLVMALLNHSSEASTLKYLGLDQSSQEAWLDKIDFG
jgi:integrase